jgi:hypothetical protein
MNTSVAVVPMRLLYPSIPEPQQEKRESVKHLRAYIKKPKNEIKLDQNDISFLENIGVDLGGKMEITSKGTADSELEDGYVSELDSDRVERKDKSRKIDIDMIDEVEEREEQQRKKMSKEENKKASSTDPELPSECKWRSRSRKAVRVTRMEIFWRRKDK